MAVTERASVILMRGHGDQRLRQAIMQGLVQQEVADDINELLRQLDSAKKENETLSNSYNDVAIENQKYKQILTDAARVAKREEERKRKRADIIGYTTLVGVVFILVLASSLITKAIFG